MTLEELRWFVAVADREHVSDAATELHISQPALSRALSRVQAEVGVPLFDRQGRRLRLNRYGRVYRDHARRALAELDAARADLAEETGVETGLVVLAFLHTLGTWLVPSLLRGYEASHPGMNFRLAQESAPNMLTALRAGEVDLIITSPQPDDPAIAWQPLLNEPLRLAVPPGHPLAGRRRVRLADVAHEPFVLMKREYGLRGMTDRLFEAAGIRPPVAFEGDDAETLRGLVAAGLGVSLIPAPYSAAPGARVVPSTPHLRVADRGAFRTIGLAWERDRYRSPATEAFRAYVTANARALAEAIAPAD